MSSRTEGYYTIGEPEEEEGVNRRKILLPGMREEPIGGIHVMSGLDGKYVQSAGCTWGVFHANSGSIFTCSRGEIHAYGDEMTDHDEMCILLAQGE